MGQGHGLIEVIEELAAVRVDQPVVEHQNLVRVHLGRVGFFHDQRTGQATRHLLHRIGVSVIPVGSGIRRHEVIVEGVAGRHRVLRQASHAVHRVVDADAVPVDRGRHVEVVDQTAGDPFALSDADRSARQHSVIRPHLGHRVAVRGKLDAGFARCQVIGRGGPCRADAERRHAPGTETATGEVETFHHSIPFARCSSRT